MILSRIYKTEGVVIKRNNSGETDKIILVYTKEYGKIRVLAKGIRRITSHRSGHLELFSHVLITLYRSKVLDVIREASRIPDTLTSQRQNSLHRTLYAYYLCELVDKLTPEGQKQTEVYDLLVTALEALTSSAAQNQSKLFGFSRRLLWTLGYLARASSMSDAALKPYIERIIERKLRTPAILTSLPTSE